MHLRAFGSLIGLDHSIDTYAGVYGSWFRSCPGFHRETKRRGWDDSCKQQNVMDLTVDWIGLGWVDSCHGVTSVN